MANDALRSERALEISYSIEAVENKSGLYQNKGWAPLFEEALFYIRTFCLSQILFEKNMSFALILLFLVAKR